MKLVQVIPFALTILKFSSSLPTDQGRIVATLDLSRYAEGIFKPPSRSAGKKLELWAKSKLKGNPEEQGTYFEGDIVLHDEPRNGVIVTSQKWKDGKVPFVIKGSFSQQQKNLLSDAIEEFKKHTCLKFIPRAGEKDYIVFENEATGCWSHVGKIGGRQTINLQTPSCVTKVGTAMHEILHAVGFYHEQNRYDRDQYVRVNFENIPKDMFSNFEKMSEDEISPYGVNYDYESVLHYSPYAFSMNNKKTIEPVGSQTSSDKMGQREGFSQKDIKKINAMYCQK